ncbi:hypothetical protein [Nocardia crassostreae]|uniref:hypothetical protein n=1 Tax=Nocardia crassostreae TaxID=53428 RepID=UPI00082FF0FB|nr:hypothetical protein [Nocardia crassostreae]
MMAIAAAVAFGLALLLDLTNGSVGNLAEGTFVILGLLLLALHFAGVGSGTRSWNMRSWRRTRR